MPRSIITLLIILLTSSERVTAGDTHAVLGKDTQALALSDLEGKQRTPLATSGLKGAVLVFVTHDCPVSNAYSPELKRLNQKYSKLNFGFTLVYVDPDVKPAVLLAHRKEYGLNAINSIHDTKHQLVTATGAKVTPEAVLIIHGGRIAYRGRIDNLYADYGKRRRAATVRDLRNALDAVLAGKPVTSPRTEAIGCFISLLKK